MGWKPGQPAASGQGHGPGAPAAGIAPGRDPSLVMFAAEGGFDALIPSALLALAADAAAGRGRYCPGATADERVGLVRAFAALESWAAASKHGVIAQMIRADDAPRPAGGTHGDLPDTWSPSLRHELALALACPVQSAETTAWLAWELHARLPGIRALLESGTLTLPKARAVIDTFKYLADADAAAAEALVAGRLAGKTYPQVLRLAEEAALAIDPELAERRRLQAQKSARVTCFRELSGTAGLSGRDLPPDEALAAMAAVNARAQAYEDSGTFGSTPMDALRAYAYLDLLTSTPAEDRIRCAVAQDEAAEIAEALAWANTRAARAAAQSRAVQESPAGPKPGGPRTPPAASAAADQHDGPGGQGRHGCSSDEEPRSPHSSTADDKHHGDSNDDDDDPDFPEDDGGLGSGGPGPREPGPGQDAAAADSREETGAKGSGPGQEDSGPGPGTPPAPRGVRAFQKRPPDLTIPLATLLGLAERPAEAQGFGLLDPALARALATAAAASPRTEICVTVTSPEGWAIGHGCARPDRTAHLARPPDGAPPLESPLSQSPLAGTPPAASADSAVAAVGPAATRPPVPCGLPARLNLTISDTDLAELANPAGPVIATSRAGSGLWFLSPRGSTEPSGGLNPLDGYGTWTLTLPDRRRFTARLDVVPTLACDHRYEAPGYHPNAKLRHLVQVRDGTCTFPTCNRHARESDFEHAQPYEKGGRTDACNAGARSRACHRVKQSPGWHVTQQPKPGWHQWQSPTGRIYVQEPKRYLA